MHRVWGRAQTSTDGLQHAPSGPVDAVERVTRGLRIEGLAAAAACAFCLSADQPPPPPSSARTARTCVRSRTTWSTVRAARTQTRPLHALISGCSVSIDPEDPQQIRGGGGARPAVSVASLAHGSADRASAWR